MRLIQISAWNDSGGGFTHRLLDGHPGLRPWPFELLLGRDHHDVDGFGEDWFRGRFRWPRFGAALAARDGGRLFDLVSDAELKGVMRDPADAKHARYPVAVDLTAWRSETARRWADDGRYTQAAFIESYIEGFLSLHEGGGDGAGSGRPVLAHCPVAILDAPETWADLPETRFICVIRSPLSGFADMRRRHPQLDPVRYAAKWSLINATSALWAGKRGERVRLVMLRELLDDRERTMRGLCAWLGLPFDPVTLRPSWRGQALPESDMGPFGGVPALSCAREEALAEGLDAATRDALVLGTNAVAMVLADVEDLPTGG